MTQKSLLHAVAAQIANGYETAEVPMYSEQLRMPDRKVIIKIIENLQKVFFPAYFAGGTVSHVSAETFAEFLLGEIYTDLCEQVHLAFSNTIKLSSADILTGICCHCRAKCIKRAAAKARYTASSCNCGYGLRTK